MDRKEMLTKRIKEYCRKNHLIEKGDGIVVGVSGGADSIFLLWFLVWLQKEISFRLIAVHVHHGIRGKEADRDQHFVEDFAKKCNVEIVVFHGNIPEMARKNGTTEEEEGRKFRYACFEKVRIDRKFTKIAVAHHLDDQAETVLFQMIRGSSMRGLAGMRPQRDQIIRPLLCVERVEIEQALQELEISYVTDSTNLSTEYTRNKLRRKVIPYIQKEIQPAVTKHIAKMADDVREAWDFINAQTAIWYEKLVSSKDERLVISLKEWSDIPTIIQRELLLRMMEACCGRRKDLTRQHVESLQELFKGDTGKRIRLPYQMAAGKDYEVAWIQQISEEDEKNSSMESFLVTSNGQIVLKDYGSEGGVVTFSVQDREKLSSSVPRNYCTKWIDYDKIMFMLAFRHPQKGDYFILGTKDGKKKKLSRFLIDCKLPLEQRETLWVLADGNHIVWIPRYDRVSTSYYVDDDTKQVMCFFYEPLSEEKNNGKQ